MRKGKGFSQEGNSVKFKQDQMKESLEEERIETIGNTGI